MPRIILLAFFVVFMGSGTHALGEEISVRFVAIPKIIQSVPLELMTGEGSSIKVEIPGNSLSPVYTIERPDHWILGRTIRDEKGKETFETYGRTPILPDKQQLILVIPQTANATFLNLIPLKMSGLINEGGSFLLFNTTDYEISGNVSADEFKLLPGENAVLSPAPSKTEGSRKYCYAEFSYKQNDQVHPRPFYTSTLRLSDNARSFMFFYNEPHQGKLHTHTIRDYLR